MNDALLQFLNGRRADVVAAFKQNEERALRLARIQNGTHPDFLNGHPKDQEKGRPVMPKKRKKKRGY